MTAFVEECRREWKRLGVPDLLAEEMATELEADLAEAQADGVSAAEMLGESDPRRFAAAWARERGLAGEPPPKKSRKRLWIGLAMGLVLVLIVLPGIGILLASVGGGSTGPVQAATQVPEPVRAVVIPNFVGLKACHARRIALQSGLKTRKIPSGRCNALVVAQTPRRGTLIEGRRAGRTTVTLRLRARR